MSVSRISMEALRKILTGQVKEDFVCVIKFYSNGCHLCHNLKDYYEDLSKSGEYNDMHFFAFNVDDYPQIEKQMNFNGVPTISKIKTFAGDKKPEIAILQDPSDPSEHTWYTIRDIRNFIKEKKYE